MKSLLTVLLLLSATAYAQHNHHQPHVIIPTIPGTHYIQPTYPGTQYPDYTQSALAVQPDGVMYPVYPGTHQRIYDAPAYIPQGDHYQPTVPGTFYPDYTQPGYIVK